MNKMHNFFDVEIVVKIIDKIQNIGHKIKLRNELMSDLSHECKL